MLSFLLGVATFTAAVKLKKTLRKASVEVTSQVIGLVDHAKTTAFGIKEGFEDIVAEAQYKNMQRNVDQLKENEHHDTGDSKQENAKGE